MSILAGAWSSAVERFRRDGHGDFDPVSARQEERGVPVTRRHGSSSDGGRGGGSAVSAAADRSGSRGFRAGGCGLGAETAVSMSTASATRAE
ncbi:hypothetical protein EJB05_54720, partial [Eragrostis curvula]